MEGAVLKIELETIETGQMSQFYDSEQPIQRKVQESVRQSQSVLESTKDTGIAILEKLRSQGERLRGSHDRLTPIAARTADSGKLVDRVLSSLSSGRRLFFVLAFLTIFILFVVLKWKHSR